jgi:diguanylate cyclase (GGDEF)-like protein
MDVDFLHPPKVLIVNDNASTLLALSSVLTDPSEIPKYDVFTVLSGEEALREVLKHDFAVILLDVSMPGMDGFETAEAIRSHPRSALVPIIFVTAYYGDELNRLKGYQKGAADYLFAPIIPQIVQAKVAIFVELHQKSLELERKTAALESINSDLRVQRLMDLERVNKALNNEVAERRLAEQRATELATRDTLTGLFNRRSLLERLRHSIIQASRRGEGLALMFLDWDRFKEINDTFGHEVGDELLKQVANQLNASVRESDMVARLGGDEFVILLEGFPDTADVIKVARKIISANIEPLVIGSHRVKTSTTIGISLYPQDGATAEELLKNADVAMYHAKQRERGSIQFFHEELNATERLRNEFEQDVQHALESDEFELFYQPKIDVASGMATGVEALLYWHHPRDGLLASHHFISRVAQSTQASRVCDWVISSVCAQIRHWNNLPKPLALPIAINLDITHLQPDFFNTIAHSMEKYEVDPANLHFEIDESAVVSDLARAAAIFSELTNGGVSITLDGFGAGFSSLAALKALPISAVKIDPHLMQSSGRQHSFLPAQAAFPADTSIYSALLAMSRAFGLRIVAEGVETQEQFDALKTLGCDEYQGTFFSEPLSADDLLRRLQLTNLLSCSA